MRTNRKIPPPPHDDIEPRLDRLAQDCGSRLGLRRVIDVGVIAFDQSGIGWIQVHDCRLLVRGAAMPGLYLIGGNR